MGWKKLSAILGGIASALAILTYFGLQPHHSSDGGSSQTYQNSGENYPVQPATTRPIVIPTTHAPVVVRTTTPSTPRATAVRTTAGPPRTGTGVVQVPAGQSLKVYNGPALTATWVTSVPAGTRVTILCTAYGGAVTDPSDNHTSNLWDRISSGFVPDVYIDTGTNDPVAPPC